MRILLVNMYYSPNMMGGAEHSVKLLAEGLMRQGESVAVLTMDGTNRNSLTKEFINKVLIYRGYSKNIFRRRIKGNKNHLTDKILNGFHSIYNFKMNKYVREAIEDFKPDVVHTNNLVSMSYWIWDYCKKKDIPIVHTLRDYWLMDPSTNIGESNKIITFLFELIMRKKSNRLNGVVTAPSNSTLEEFVHRGYFKKNEKKCIVNSISLNKPLLDECMKQKINRKDNIIIFLYVGNLSVNKGIRYLLDEFQRIDNINIRLVICGDGVLTNEVKQKSALDTRIILKGKLGSKELQEEYYRADVLIVPSLWKEPFGRIVIEAAQYATPTIGSNNGGIPETINSLQFGMCYYDCNVGTLSRNIEYYSYRENILKDVAKGPHNIEKYDIYQQINNFMDLYKEINSKVRNG